MTGCATIGKPASEKKAKADVEEIFGYELTLTDAEDLQIQNFIAVLGGSCFFSEAEKGADGAGYSAYLGDDSYFFGFTDDKSQVMIRKNDEEYFFDLTMYNPAMDEYSFAISREDVEKIFGISIEIQKETSNFIVKNS